uniref:DUF262 domain-containing protein n=1 Tax=Attheya septentrionalis TaxID=420275 RepID=A0A7S2U6Y8_9STRA|mmetsp:Transcript_13106/g.23756  ORF Transcript_13106/g.23756 Transcript_13106/m.23756 type:complete len:675 (+) Transcript_13106:134-2158(+)
MGYRLLILAYLAVCLARYTDGFSFNPLPSRVQHRPAFSKTRTLGKTDDSETASGGLDVPFFASFSASGDLGTTTVTTRVPLGTLFDSRDYIFCTATNVRGYEWTLKETDQLFDDLSDVAVGSSPNAHRGDYELSQIVLVPTEWDRTLYGIGNRYDVHDGQQRLVTLCLLLGALRESFRNESGMAATVEELTSMLNPPKVRKEPVLRIALRKRDNDILSRILLPDLIDDGDNTPYLNLPQTKECKVLTLANKRILENFNRLLSRATDLTKEARLKLLDYLVEHVYLLVCVPETAMIARNIVMSQGKGMDNEPIDDFKGLVCFRYTSKEDDMYSTFDKWDELAGLPDDNAAVGRDIVASACLLRATADLRSKIRRNDEVFALENWLRKDLIQNGYEGKEFFQKQVQPASLALKRFRDGSYDAFSWSNNSNGKLRDTITMRLRFLRRLTANVASTKELEMLILELLLRGGGTQGHKALSLKHLDEYLHAVEVAALWMITDSPSPVQRYQRCFDILDAINDESEDLKLSEEENSNLKNVLVSFEFGATATGKKTALALLERLNSFVLIDSGLETLPESSAKQVEHILPANTSGKYWKEHWPSESDKDEWTHRLGNMVLLSQKATVTKMRKGYTDKLQRYEAEVWPLTRGLSKVNAWDKEALLEQQQLYNGLIFMAWGL